MEKRKFSGKELLLLVLPMFVEQLLSYSVGFIDTVMVSSISEVALSATNFANTINGLFIGLFSAFATGGGVIVAQYLGKNDEKAANSAAKQLIYTISAISFILMLLALLLKKPVLNALYGSVIPEMYKGIDIYFTVTAFSYIFLAVYNGGAAILRTAGNSRATMYAAIYMNIFNVAGNYLLIYIFKWGIFGAAVATVIARGVAATVIISNLKSHKNSVKIDSFLKFEFNKGMVRNILRLGVPGGIDGIAVTLGYLLCSRLYAGLPVYQIAAYTAVSSFDPIMGIFNSSMGFAIVSTVSRCIGASDIKQAKYYSMYFIKLSYVFGFFVMGGLIVFAPQVVKLFNLSPEAVECAVLLLCLNQVINIFMRPMSLFGNVFQASGDVKYLLKQNLVNLWFIRVPVLYLARYVFGLEYELFILSSFLGFGCITVSHVFRYKSGKWLDNKIT